MKESRSNKILASKLLKEALNQNRLFIEWDNCETGAPAIDCKRPYGNSYVAGDVKEILSMPELTDSEALDIHETTLSVLYDFIATGTLRNDET